MHAQIYTENFPNSTGANRAMSTVGWNAAVGPSGTDTSTATTNYVVSFNLGQGNVAGYVGKTSTGTVGLAYTSEYVVDRSAFSISTISFYSNNTSAADSFRIALQIGGNWYATDTAFSRNSTTAGSPSNFPSNAELESFAFTDAAASWRALTFASGTSLSLSGTTLGSNLPGGNITAFGLYSASNVGVLRFDTFQISATPIPEPSAAGLLLVGGWLLARRRRAA
jgi:hypothetical protein